MKSSYFTSDHHFYHYNIIKYTQRPFSSTEEMNEAMFQNWNAVIKPDDYVYHLGDFAFCDVYKACDLLDRLNGIKFLIEGNHDRKLLKEKRFRDKFGWIDKMAGVEVNGQYIILCHYAMRVWDKSHHGSWQLFGHSHAKLPDLPDSLSMDVGVDTNDFKPYSFDDIKQIMSKKTFVNYKRTKDKVEL